MLRTVGFVLLFGVSCLVSLEMLRHQKRVITHTEALCRLVRYIKENIDLFMTPVGNILSEYSDEVMENCGFSEAVRQSGLADAMHKGHLCLSDESRRAFCDFADSLGTSYRAEEVNRCTYFESVLSRSAELEKEKLEKNKKLYLFIPPLCALSVILVAL